MSNILKFLSYKLFFKRNSRISNTAKVYWLSKITNTVIRDYSYIGPLCDINNCDIGKFCSIANNVKIGMGLHPTKFISTSPIFYSPTNPLKKKFVGQKFFDEYKKVKIGNDVWIGSSAIIMDGVTIGDGVIIGANAVVTKDVIPYSIVVGVPAKVIKMRFGPEIVRKLLDLKWWDFPIDIIKKDLTLKFFTKIVDESIIIELKKCIKKHESFNNNSNI